MEEIPNLKWEAKLSTKLTKANAHQIWLLYTDFFNIHNYFPNITCHAIHGTNGEPGCVRYCTSPSFPPQCGNGDRDLGWAKERLISVDHDNRCMSYDILECNIGFKRYVATVKVVPAGSDGDGCVIEWSFSVDPIDGWVFEDLVGKFQVALQFTAQKMEYAICSKSVHRVRDP